ncbi:hypothetical protein BEL04_14995 [Mucilaginibacter sp. PPCGB 2223]|uniref:hypothetical protein n=1 Tax=Mucilaginibacter sp. PPCGB 2223 TaxID=1886027 RepID=UPI000824D693|nr:hypothetical protein [Mucilaginibacter sp. PPCGB 2223]OCX51335.1 hypothetical protein BEL04_14995 [Mucilaginibacter sp. PPCGB 2223]
MRKYFYLFTLFVFIITVYSCTLKASRRNLIKIYPLSPYIDSVKFDKDEDVGKERRNGIKIKYYLINESVDYTELTKDRIKDFIRDSLHNELKRYPAVYFTFYKKGSGLDRDFQQTADNKLATNYKDNKFAEFEYINGQLFNFDFYKDGEYYVPPVINEESNSN